MEITDYIYSYLLGNSKEPDLDKKTKLFYYINLNNKKANFNINDQIRTAKELYGPRVEILGLKNEFGKFVSDNDFDLVNKIKIESKNNRIILFINSIFDLSILFKERRDKYLCVPKDDIIKNYLSLSKMSIIYFELNPEFNTRNIEYMFSKGCLDLDFDKYIYKYLDSFINIAVQRNIISDYLSKSRVFSAKDRKKYGGEIDSNYIRKPFELRVNKIKEEIEKNMNADKKDRLKDYELIAKLNIPTRTYYSYKKEIKDSKK